MQTSNQNQNIIWEQSAKSAENAHVCAFNELDGSQEERTTAPISTSNPHEAARLQPEATVSHSPTGRLIQKDITNHIH
jgi:hypothetical protein